MWGIVVKTEYRNNVKEMGKTKHVKTLNGHNSDLQRTLWKVHSFAEILAGGALNIRRRTWVVGFLFER